MWPFSGRLSRRTHLTETVVDPMTLHATLVPDSLKSSPDSRKVAYVLSVADGQAVSVNGRLGRTYLEVGRCGRPTPHSFLYPRNRRDDSAFGTPMFSPDSSRLAFVARCDRGWLLVVDDTESTPCTALLHSNSLFSCDGRRVAFAGQHSPNGSPSGSPDPLSGLGKWCCVIDGQESEAFDDVGFGSPVISADGKRVAWIAGESSALWVPHLSEGRRWCVVVDGKKGQLYDGIASAQTVFSPDGSHVGYVAQDRRGKFVVIDGAEGKPYEDIGAGSPTTLPTFSPDGKRVAFSAKLEDKWRVVVDGVEGKPYDAVLPPVWSGDSQHLAYGASENGKTFLVQDGKEGRACQTILYNEALFCPASTRTAYVAHEGSAQFVVVDGVALRRHEHVVVDEHPWSSDGRRLIYAARRGGKSFVVVDDREHGPYDDIRAGSLTFSPGDRHVAYGVKRGNRWLVLVDDKEGPEYDLLIDGRIHFDNAEEFHYLVVQHHPIVLVEEKLV